MTTCPITGGLPTKMTEAGFTKACQAQQQQGPKSIWIARPNLNPCRDQCQGKTWPPELTICTLEDLMSTTKECLKCKRTISIRGEGLCHRCFYEIHPKPTKPTGEEFLQMAGNQEQPHQAPPKSVHDLPSPEIAEALTIMEADRDLDTLANVCRQRMERITNLQEIVNGLYLEIDDINQRHQQEVHPQVCFSNDHEPGTMAYHITKACDRMCYHLLVMDSSFSPNAASAIRVFSRATPLEAINLRLDDTIHRMIIGEGEANNDQAEKQLLSLLILKMAIKDQLEA